MRKLKLVLMALFLFSTSSYAFSFSWLESFVSNTSEEDSLKECSLDKGVKIVCPEGTYVFKKEKPSPNKEDDYHPVGDSLGEQDRTMEDSRYSGSRDDYSMKDIRKRHAQQPSESETTER